MRGQGAKQGGALRTCSCMFLSPVALACRSRRAEIV